MKSLFLTLVLVVASITANAGQLTALLAIEKGSHRLDALFKNNQVDRSFMTDIYYVTVVSTGQGYNMTWFSPSNDNNHPNSISMTIGLDGKVANQSVDFVAAYPSGPVFTTTDTATLFDLGTEAVVDHLSESAELPQVASTVTSVQMSNSNGQILLQMKLNDGRTYNVVLDQDGNFISRGF